jgi:hypothetical protein
MARWRWFGAVTLAATLCLTSCGGGSDEGGGTDSSPTASASTGSGTGTPPPARSGGGPGNGSSGSGGSGNGGGSGDDGFSYVPWGPKDPPIPGQYAAFATTSSHDLDCNTVHDQAPDGEFWVTALAVCYAIRDGAPWPDRTTVPAPPDPENAYQRCLNVELAAMLQRALRWHAHHPGRPPKISYPARSSTSPCQSRIYGIQVQLGDVAGSSGTERRIVVEIVVPTGPQDFAVTVDGQPVDDGDVNQRGDQGDGLDELTVFLDPPPQTRTVQIEVFNGRTGAMTESVDLPGVGESSSPPDTESPTPPEQTDGQTGSSSESASPNG